MIKSHKQTLTALVVVVVIGALAFGAIGAAGSISNGLAALHKSVGSLALLVCATAIVCAFLIARGLSSAGRIASLERARAARGTLYERVLQGLTGTERSGEREEAKLQEFERLLLLQAKKTVLDQYLKLRRLEVDPDSSETAKRGILERLVAEMRRDLGHSDLPLSLEEAADLLLHHHRKQKGGGPASDEFKVIREP